MKRQICPKCGSTEVAMSKNIYAMIAAPNSYVCHSCGFESSIMPEIDIKDIEKFRKNLKAEKE